MSVFVAVVRPELKQDGLVCGGVSSVVPSLTLTLGVSRGKVVSGTTSTFKMHGRSPTSVYRLNYAQNLYR